MQFAFLTHPTGTLELDPEILADLTLAAFEMITVGSEHAGISGNAMIEGTLSRSQRKMNSPDRKVHGFKYDFDVADTLGAARSTGTFIFFEVSLPARFELMEFFAKLMAK